MIDKKTLTHSRYIFQGDFNKKKNSIHYRTRSADFLRLTMISGTSGYPVGHVHLPAWCMKFTASKRLHSDCTFHLKGFCPNLFCSHPPAQELPTEIKRSQTGSRVLIYKYNYSSFHRFVLVFRTLRTAYIHSEADFFSFIILLSIKRRTIIINILKLQDENPL